MLRDRRWYTREFKLAALARMKDAPNVLALAQELGVGRETLHRWHAVYRRGGAEALRGGGRPGPMVMPLAPVDASGLPASSAASQAGSPAQAVAAAGEAARTHVRMAELERKVGQQQLELDFFRAALRHVRAQRRRTGAPGETASTQ